MHLDDDAIREWTELAQLYAIDLGEQLGLLSDGEAAERRPGVGPVTSGTALVFSVAVAVG